MRCRPLLLTAVLLLLFAGGEARASYLTGLYVLVEKVVPEKNEAGQPERIKVLGVFMNELEPMGVFDVEK